jgi:hypothetical protein
MCNMICSFSELSSVNASDFPCYYDELQLLEATYLYELLWWLGMITSKWQFVLFSCLGVTLYLIYMLLKSLLTVFKSLVNLGLWFNTNI